MQGRFYIGNQLGFSSLIKVLIGNINPLLYTGVIHQHVQIAVFGCDPFKKCYTPGFISQIANPGDYARELSRASCKTDSRLPQIITVLPSLINLSVNPNPIPLAPPVINILLPDNFIVK